MAITTGFLGSFHSATDFAEFNRNCIGNGCSQYLNQLKVTSTNTMSVSVKTGFAFLSGFYVILDVDQMIELTEADPFYPRYDTVVARVNQSDRTVDLKIIAGSPASNPTKRSPTRTDLMYDIVLAYIYVRANTSQIIASDIEDTRADPYLCGDIPTQAMLQQKVDSIDSAGLSQVNQQLIQNLSESNQLVSYANTRLASMVDSVGSILSPILLSMGKIFWSINALDSSPRFLLCNGSTIPSNYAELISFLGQSTTPNLCSSADVIRAYICATNPL